MDDYKLVEALVARILFTSSVFSFNVMNIDFCPFSYISMTIVLFNIHFHEDMSDITEELLVLYAQMANLVHLILHWPEINIKEIAENFSKVLCFKT